MVSLEFSALELAQARRVNSGLMFMPRFRAPSPFRKALIQSSLRMMQMLAPHGVAGVRTTMRLVDWKGQSFGLRVLRTDVLPRGVYIDYHGGGWSIGNAAMDDRVNARIAADCGLVVASIDYTLLPETTLPGMIEQCAAAADWVFEHAPAEFGASDLIIGGESAGAHLAACALLKMRARHDFGRMKGAVLFYGPYDLSCTPSVRAAKRDTLVLDGPAMTTGIARLLPDRTEDERRAPDVSPLHADLSGLPPGLLLVGTLDPLIDDSRLMAERWQAQSGNAELVIAQEAPHAFNRLPTRAAARTNAFVRRWIDARLADAPAMKAAE